MNDRALTQSLALAANAQFQDRVSAACALLKDRSFLISPGDIRTLELKRMNDPLLAVEILNKTQSTYLKLEEYLAGLSQTELYQTLPSDWVILPLTEQITAKDGPATTAYEISKRRVTTLGKVLEENIGDTRYLSSLLCRSGDPEQLMLDLDNLGSIRGVAKLRNLKSYMLTSEEFFAGVRLPTTNHREILISGQLYRDFINNLIWGSPEVITFVHQVESGIRSQGFLDYSIIESEDLPELSNSLIVGSRILIRDNGQLYFESEYEALLVAQNRVRTTLLNRRQRILGF